MQKGPRLPARPLDFERSWRGSARDADVDERRRDVEAAMAALDADVGVRRGDMNVALGHRRVRRIDDHALVVVMMMLVMLVVAMAAVRRGAGGEATQQGGSGDGGEAARKGFGHDRLLHCCWINFLIDRRNVSQMRTAGNQNRQVNAMCSI